MVAECNCVWSLLCDWRMAFLDDSSSFEVYDWYAKSNRGSVHLSGVDCVVLIGGIVLD